MSKENQKQIPIVSAVADGELVELVFDPDLCTTALCVAIDGEWRIERSVASAGRTLVPYSPYNNLIRHKVVLFPREPEEYGTVEQLVADIRRLIHGLVDLSPIFEDVAVHYVLLTWVFDRFPAVPYLRVRGDPGSGKTRFLSVVGSLCYKPVFASGASTVSPLFRMLDSFRGTLVLDESDFRISDEQTEIVKILNNGHAKGFPVLRTESNNQREFNPRAYDVFGPKLIATRRLFQDSALESRCLSEAMGQGNLRSDIPTKLPVDFEERAQGLRNRLLLYRLRHYEIDMPKVDELTVGLEPRLRQILEPLIGVVPDQEVRVRIAAFGHRLQEEIVSDRGMEAEARIVEVIKELLAQPGGVRLSVKDVADRFMSRFGDEYERRVTTKWIGNVIRTGLHLRTRKVSGVYVIPPEELPKLDRLYERFGIDPPDLLGQGSVRSP
jgi:hypothetical protein